MTKTIDAPPQTGSDVSLKEASRVCGTSPQTIQRWAKRDNIRLRKKEGETIIDRRALRSLLLRRGLPIPWEVEPWPRVLVVEDDPDMRQMAAWILKSVWREASICTADDATEALKILPKFHPDLLVTDLILPGMDGATLARMVQGNRDLSQTKIVAITALDTQEAREILFNSGAVEFIPKPFEPEALRRSAVRLLGRSRPSL